MFVCATSGNNKDGSSCWLYEQHNGGCSYVGDCRNRIECRYLEVKRCEPFCELEDMPTIIEDCVGCGNKMYGGE
jgi:hypothetical protein